MIEIRDLSKAFGPTRAVDDLTFTAPPGVVTGFLGPNGAGKTTTLRVLLGLARADRGTATIDGTTYHRLASARRSVGAVLETTGFHPGRTGRNHLRIIARAAGISTRRVDEVLSLVDLTDAADRRVGGYSHGMAQRLALAGALLGDPRTLVLDEPATGLDPAGIAWLRGLLLEFAAQGRTVLISSHVLAEVEAVAGRVVIIDRGRIVREGAPSDLFTTAGVVVRTADEAQFDALARSEGWRVRRSGTDALVVEGATAANVGRVAARAGVALSELSTQTSVRQLEELFLQLTGANGEAPP